MMIRKVDPMKTPRLIQRIEFRMDGFMLKNEYMGATEFESGDQGNSLERIFAKGIILSSADIILEGRVAPVYMLAGRDFSFDEYQPWLQKLAENKLRLVEPSNFDVILRLRLLLETDDRRRPSTNVWFDFQNDVLWTLSESIQKSFLTLLHKNQTLRANARR